MVDLKPSSLTGWRHPQPFIHSWLLCISITSALLHLSSEPIMDTHVHHVHKTGGELNWIHKQQRKKKCDPPSLLPWIQSQTQDFIQLSGHYKKQGWRAGQHQKHCTSPFGPWCLSACWMAVIFSSRSFNHCCCRCSSSSSSACSLQNHKMLSESWVIFYKLSYLMTQVMVRQNGTFFTQHKDCNYDS